MLLLLVALQLLAAPPAGAADNLARFIQQIPPAQAFPGADHYGPTVGVLPVVPVFKGDERIGYVFLNSDFTKAIGYSGKPIHILLGIDMRGVITAVRLVEHHEPIVLIGIPEEEVTSVLKGYIGLSVARLARGAEEERHIDIVSGATVTTMVIDDSIRRSAIRVAQTYGLGGLKQETETDAPKASIDMSRSTVEDWVALVADGAVRRLKLSIDDVNRAFQRSADRVAAERPEPGDPGDVFIEIYTALVSIPTVGRSLLGDHTYEKLEKRFRPGQHAILVAARGRYSFKGSGYVRGGIFDRFQLIQDEHSIRFRDRDHQRLRALAAVGAPDLDDVDLFLIPDGAHFDSAKPWRLELLVGRATGPTRKAFVTFDLHYSVPAKYLKVETPGEPPVDQKPDERVSPAPVLEGAPLWQRLWREKIWEIAILACALLVLTVIFFFQDWLVRRARLTYGLRIGFLLFTVFGIGFYANAQLSVVNILNVSNALVSGFDWGYFLMEPLIFILWGSVVAALLFWGRGAYCGWLCPFGALQELLNRAARALKVPQIKVPWGVHERLWACKYIIFLVLFGVSLHSLAWAERLAEVEPFKTAIILKFSRHWPFVLFAVGLLAAGLFIERFYCRYLCPLGAALAIPGKMRLFDWLRRYHQCGAPCQRCANECMVQAIHPRGNINPNECLYCLHCQVVYYDDHGCPVLIQRRLKRQRRATGRTKEELQDLLDNPRSPNDPIESHAKLNSSKSKSIGGNSHGKDEK